MHIVESDWLRSFVGQQVVVDLADSYLVIGTLTEVGPDHLAFTDADLHDHREANSTKEIYVIESRKYGIRANRQRVHLPRRLVIAISRLEDIG